MDFPQNILNEGLRSTQILIATDCLGTTTIPAHQGVGWETFSITPITSLYLCSSWTLRQKGIGTYGLALSLSFISYSSPNVPSPLNTFEKCYSCHSLQPQVTYSLSMRCKEVMAGSPSRSAFSLQRHRFLLLPSYAGGSGAQCTGPVCLASALLVQTALWILVCNGGI